MPKPRELASEKQFEYAKKISDKLGIPMPQEFTKQAYFSFIQDNSDAYKRECQRMQDEDYGLDEDDY